MSEIKGLSVEIFSNPLFKGCSNGGVSEFYTEGLIVNIDAPHYPKSPLHPLLMLVKGNLPGTVKAVPVDQPEGKTGPMFGGSYIAGSDSRFSEAVEKLLGHRFYGAVPLHDRFE